METKKTKRYCNCIEMNYTDARGRKHQMPIVEHIGAVHDCAYVRARNQLIPTAEAVALEAVPSMKVVDNKKPKVPAGVPMADRIKYTQIFAKEMDRLATKHLGQPAV